MEGPISYQLLERQVSNQKKNITSQISPVTTPTLRTTNPNQKIRSPPSSQKIKTAGVGHPSAADHRSSK